MDQVITFDKSLQQRLQEFQDVLSGYEVLAVSTINREWSFYLELTVDTNGWQAIWKIPRGTCEKLNIPFPSIVLVFVLNMDLPHLHAYVRVLAVQDDIHLPEKHLVPLINLWPTKEQDKTVALNLRSTANALDMLRFFYNHLLMPWDVDEDDNLDWRSRHLESRLRLFYDMRNGVMPRVTSKHLQALLSEARRLQHKREHIEEELLEENIDYEESTNDRRVEVLMETHVRLLEIKSEVEILENPLMRKAVIKRHELMVSKNARTDDRIFLIHGNSTVDQHTAFLQQVKTLYPTEEVCFMSDFCAALDCANSNDTFVLQENEYLVPKIGALENGGSIRSFDAKKTILRGIDDDIMLDFYSGKVEMENLTINAGAAQCLVVIREAEAVFKNCTFIGGGQSSTHQGIIVLGKGTLQLIDCDISLFYTAIVGNSGANISLKNTQIHDVNLGMKIYDNCKVNAQLSNFFNCKDYAICVETENNLEGDQHQIGNFEALNIIPEVTAEFLSGSNNSKGDVTIHSVSKIRGVEDLFGIRDPTVSKETTDDEMDTDEKTSYDVTLVDENGKISPATV